MADKSQEQEASKYIQQIIQLKGKDPATILEFLTTNPPPLSKTEQISRFKAHNIKKENVLSFINAQSKIFNELLRIKREHRRIMYDYLPFADNELKQKEDEKFTQTENDLLETFNIYTLFLQSYIHDLFSLVNVTPNIENSLNGEKAKGARNKQNKINALNYAKTRWAENKEISQEKMAEEIKSKFNLRTSIRSICGWIKSADPYALKGEKRKRKPD